MKNLQFVIAFFFGSTLFSADVDIKASSGPRVEETQKSNRVEEFLFEKLQKYTDAGEKTVEVIVDKLKQESPIVVEEYLTWKFFEALVKACFQYFFVLIWFGWGIYYIMSWNKKISELRNYDFPVWHLANGIILLVSCLIFNITNSHPVNTGPIDNTLTCVKIKVAPRVFLIETVSNFIKK